MLFVFLTAQAAGIDKHRNEIHSNNEYIDVLKEVH
jgi:hypothetical protein